MAANWALMRYFQCALQLLNRSNEAKKGVGRRRIQGSAYILLGLSSQGLSNCRATTPINIGNNSELFVNLVGRLDNQ